MDELSVFTIVASHLFNQGRPAISNRGKCFYRLQEEGKVLKCAVGCLIPDSDYSKEFETKDIVVLMPHLPPSLRAELTPVKAILHDLQLVHDLGTSWTDEETLRGKLLNVAKAFGLEVEGFLATLHFPKE